MARPGSPLGNLPPPPGDTSKKVLVRKKAGESNPNVWDRLKQAEVSAQQALDGLNDELLRVEEALNALPAKSYADIEIDRKASDDGTEYITCLAFQERGDRWCLVIASGPDGMEDFWKERPLSQAPRMTRVKAAEALPELLDRIVTRAEKESVRIERAKKRAAEFAALLTTKGGTRNGG